MSFDCVHHHIFEQFQYYLLSKVAILIGTNNLNEFASGITGINYFYGSSKNPWNISRISGGSSGGSARNYINKDNEKVA